MDKREQMLDKVRKLLAKAEGTDVEAEKDTFIAAADRLMLAYSIEEAEIRDLAEGQQTVEVILHRFQVLGPRQEALATGMALLVGNIADHCRCKSVLYGMQSAKWSGMQVGLVGTKPDVEWAEMLFTSLQLQVMATISPKYEPTGDPDDEIKFIVKAKAAGWKWDKIAVALGIIPTISEFDPVTVGRPMYNRYKRYCEYHRIEQVKSSPANYQYNFMMSYAVRIGSRLADIRRLNEDASKGHELVLVSMAEAVDQKYEELFPDLKSSKVNLKKHNGSAWVAGRKAADRADLNSTPLGGRREAIG